MLLLYTYQLGYRNPLALVWFLLWRRTPDWTRRMCVLCSLYIRLADENPNDPLTFERVKAFNQHFGLVSENNLNALRFPMLASRWIWRNLLPLRAMDLSNEEHLITRLIKRTPCWLWYANLETRRNDINALITYCRQPPTVTS